MKSWEWPGDEVYVSLREARACALPSKSFQVGTKISGISVKRPAVLLLVMAATLLVILCLMTSFWSPSEAKKKGPLVTDKVSNIIW